MSCAENNFRESPEKVTIPEARKAKRSFTFVDLFSGIGGFHSAAGSLGGTCVFACEIDPEARRAYTANYGIEPHGDIT